MLRIRFRHLLIGCALISANVSMASAQDIASQQKRAAIKELLELTGVQRYMVATFEESVTRYQQNWAGAVITDFKAKGLFKPLTPQDAAKMEKLITELGDNIFNEIKRRVGQEVATTENLVTLSESTFNKYFTADEINELVAFYKTPTGKKFSDEHSKALAAAMISNSQAKGVFNVLPSPEAEQAKVDRLQEEIEHRPSGQVQQVLAATKIPADHFTEAERRELSTFFQTPLGRKLTEMAPRFMAEILTNNVRLLAPQVGKLTEEVIDRQMEVFRERAHEILKNYGPQGRRKQTSGG